MNKVARAIAAAAVILNALVIAPPARAQAMPDLTDDLLKQAGAALHVDAQTGRVAGVTPGGPVAEVGAKIIDVLYGDYATGEWLAYMKGIDGEYVKPAVSQRLVLLKRDGDRGVLVDADYSPAARDALARQLAEYRRKAELLSADVHVPDYLLRSATNAVLHIEIQKSAPFDRGRGNLSAVHTVTVRGVAQGDFKPGQSIEYTEESGSHKRFEPPANRQRIVLLTYSRSVQDGQMKWWLHERVNFGYTDGGFRTLQSDVARVREAQAQKAAK
jgi:hypothetical protein